MARFDRCAKCGETQKRNRGHEPYRVLEIYSYFNAPERRAVCPNCAKILERNKDKGRNIQLPEDVGDVEWRPQEEYNKDEDMWEDKYGAR